MYNKQCYAERQALGEVSHELLETQVNPAVWEISGHMVLKRKEDYEEASEEKAWRLLAEVSLSEERFKEVKDIIFEVVSAAANEDECITLVSSNGQAIELDTHQDGGAHNNGSGNTLVSHECLVLL